MDSIYTDPLWVRCNFFNFKRFIYFIILYDCFACMHVCGAHGGQESAMVPRVVNSHVGAGNQT